MWKDLTLRQRAQLIQMGVRAGIGSANTIRKLYDQQNTFSTGGVKPKIQVSGTFADSETGDYRHPIEAARQKLFPYYKDYVASLNKSGDPLDDAALYYNFHQMMLDAFDDLERAYGNKFNDMTDMQQAALLSAYFQGKKEGRNIVGKGSPFYYSYIQGNPIYDYIKAPTGPENALRKMWWEYKDTHPFTVDKEGYNRFGEAMSFNLPEAVIEAPKKTAPTTPTPPIDWEYNEEVVGMPPLQEKQKEENEKPILKKVVRERMPGFDPEALYTNFGDRDNHRYKTFKYELDPDKVIMDNKAQELKNLETVGFLQRMQDIYSPVEDEFYVNPMLHANGGNLFANGSRLKSPIDPPTNPWGVSYKPASNYDVKYNEDNTVEPLWFYDWAPEGTNRDTVAPGYMFESGINEHNATLGNLYNEYWDKTQAYNREINKQNHPEQFWDTYHDAAVRQAQNGSASDIFNGAMKGLVNIASAPIELYKGFTIPGYTPYNLFGNNHPMANQTSDTVDRGVNGVFAAVNPLSYIDWGSAGMEGSHVKLPWNPNSNGVETPAVIDAAGFIAMPYVAEGLGMAGKTAGKYISDIHKGRSITNKPWGKQTNFDSWMESDFPKYFIVEDAVPRIANKIAQELNIPLEEVDLNFMKQEISDYIDNIPVKYEEMDALGTAGKDGITYKKGIIPTIQTKIHEIMHRIRQGYIEDEIAETMPSDVNGKSRYDVWDNDRGQINPERDEIYTNGITAQEADILNDAYSFSKEYIENNPGTHLLREKASVNTELRSAIAEKASKEKGHIVTGKELDTYIDALSNRELFEIMNALNSAYMQDWLSLVKNRRTSNLNTSFDLFPEEARKVGRHGLAKKYNDKFFSAPVKKALKEVGGYALPFTIGNLLIGNNDQKANGGKLI